MFALLIHSGWGPRCAAASQAPVYQYEIPPATEDGWGTAPASQANLDTALIADLFDRVIRHEYINIHSVLLVRHGVLVVEEYFPGPAGRFDRLTRHNQQSVTKSVTSILIGIALDQQLIGSVEERVATFFPEFADLFADSAKAGMRLKHLLSMTAGLSWDEWTRPYTDPRNDLIQMLRSDDRFRYLLNRPVVAKPGSRFVYNGGITLLLGEILRRVSGLRVDAFAERYLFAPLGITDYQWETFRNGTVHTAGGLALRPRDMAKIGTLMLNGGRWQGKQLVSEAWVRTSTAQQAPTHDQWYAWWVPFFARSIFKKTPLEHNEYGYQWWLGSFRVHDRVLRSFRAEGRGGQAVFVFPDLQMVAVFTGWNDNELGNGQPLDMLQRYLLPAAR